MAQGIGAGHLAGKRLADPHRQRRRRRLALLHHVEMVIEGGDFVNLGARELELLGQREDMRRRNMSIPILNSVQELDQQVAPAWRTAKQSANLGYGLRVDGASLRISTNAAFAAERRCID